MHNWKSCRSLKANVVGNSEILNIPAYEYEIDKDVFDNGATVPGSECFCGGGPCMKPGVFNVSECKFGELIFFPRDKHVVVLHVGGDVIFFAVRFINEMILTCILLSFL